MKDSAHCLSRVQREVGYRVPCPPLCLSFISSSRDFFHARNANYINYVYLFCCRFRIKTACTLTPGRTRKTIRQEWTGEQNVKRGSCGLAVPWVGRLKFNSGLRQRGSKSGRGLPAGLGEMLSGVPDGGFWFC